MVECGIVGKRVGWLDGWGGGGVVTVDCLMGSQNEEVGKWEGK